MSTFTKGSAAFQTTDPQCHISATLLLQYSVQDRKSSNGQKGAEHCLVCICAISAVISDVMKNHTIGF